MFSRSISRIARRPQGGPEASAPTPMRPTVRVNPDAAERAALVAAAREWGYFSGDAIKQRRDLWRGARMLDVGMGAGSHSISFIEGGASI